MNAARNRTAFRRTTDLRSSMLTMARISWLPRKAEAAAIELDAARRKFVEHARVRHKVRCPWLLRVHPPSEITRFARTGWWMTQSRSNPSLVKFPVKQGKNREFARFPRRSWRLRHKKAWNRLGFFSKFPTQRNRELFLDNRDLFRRIREFTGQIREISNSPHTRK
jgi:hypothetical protein